MAFNWLKFTADQLLQYLTRHLSYFVRELLVGRGPPQLNGANQGADSENRFRSCRAIIPGQ